MITITVLVLAALAMAVAVRAGASGVAAATVLLVGVWLSRRRRPAPHEPTRKAPNMTTVHPLQAKAISRFRPATQPSAPTLAMTCPPPVLLDTPVAATVEASEASPAIGDIVDEWGRQSFPASDPPANW